MTTAANNLPRSCPYDARVQHISISSPGGNRNEIKECIDTLLQIDGGKWQFIGDIWVPHHPDQPSGGGVTPMIGDSNDDGSAAFIPLTFYGVSVRLAYGVASGVVWTTYTPAIDNWCRYDVMLSDGNQVVRLNDDFIAERHQAYVPVHKTIKIGCMRVMGSHDWTCVVPRIGTRYGAVKIFHNDVLVRDFVPVRAGDEGCMFDRVEWKLYKSIGTVKFMAGPDLKGVS